MLRKLWTKMGKFYAVAVGRKCGVFPTWQDCEESIKNFPGARFKKFNTLEEATQFLTSPTSVNLDAFKNKLLTSSKKRKHEDSCGKKRFKRAGANRSTATNTSSNDINITWSVNDFNYVSDSALLEASSALLEACSDRPIVYTDGGCSKNGRCGARAGIGVFWGPNHSHNISERLEGAQTNQRAELMAAIKALESAQAQDYKSIEVRTDSRYTIMGITDWIKRWKRNGYKSINGNDVKNSKEFRKLDELCKVIDVKWTHVPAHIGIPGNEAADSLATEGKEKELRN